VRLPGAYEAGAERPGADADEPSGQGDPERHFIPGRHGEEFAQQDGLENQAESAKESGAIIPALSRNSPLAMRQL
jgi:hypothetical protein